MQNKNSYSQWPDDKGYFGKFGGRYVSETLMPLIEEVEKEYNNLKYNKDFLNEFEYYLANYIGRPSPLFFAERITNDLKGFYKDLWTSEARHGNVFVKMALEYFDQKRVYDRLEYLMDHEGELISTLPVKPALH